MKRLFNMFSNLYDDLAIMICILHQKLVIAIFDCPHSSGHGLGEDHLNIWVFYRDDAVLVGRSTMWSHSKNPFMTLIHLYLADLIEDINKYIKLPKLPESMTNIPIPEIFHI